MKIIAKALSVCIVLCAIIVLIMAGISHLSNKENTAIEKKPKITSEFVGNRIQEISELATLAHHYRKNITDKILNIHTTTDKNTK